MTRMHRSLMVALLIAGVMPAMAMAQYNITVLHNNDGESQLLGDANYGSIARFKTMVDDTRSAYQGLGHGVVTVYAGDSFLASPEFQASLDSGPAGSRNFYDAFALSEIGYDAAVFGNHEFDFGPDVLAEFIGDAQSTNAVPYISANLDFSGEASLNALVGSNIFSSTTVSVGTVAGPKTVGIIGATTENLPFISSPGGVVVNPIAAAVNAEIASLSGSVDHIILVSHLQGIGEDLALIPQLSPGVDLVVAGGGDEILANLAAPAAPGPASVATTGLKPGDTVDQPAYPNTSALDSGGNTVPVVTGGPNYNYLGRVTLSFDAAGNLLGATPDSNPQLVQSLAADPVNGVAKDPTVEANSEAPVDAYVQNLANIIIATSSQTLVGNGDRDVIRAKEAALGNLVADGMLAAGIAEATNFGVDTPDFAISNGGGIRDDIPAGDVSVKSTFDVSPFGNTVSIVEDMTREDIKLMFENAYSKTEDGQPGPGIDPVRQPVGGTGRFLHVSEGVEIVYDITGTPMVLDNDGNIVTAGDRIVSIKINGVTIVDNGAVIPGGTFDVAVVDFLAGGGDQIFEDYLSQAYGFTRVGVTDQNALQDYIEGLAGGNPTFDLISDSRYDNTPDGRIVVIPEPSSLALLALAGFALLRRRVA